jgi:hypothetical protein
MANINDKLFTMLVRAIKLARQAELRGHKAMASRLRAIVRAIGNNI